MRTRLSIPVVCLVLAGCGGPPPLHPVGGKITLGGKSYPRLIVYFRPAEGQVTEFNMGIGETDKAGALTLRTSAGPGLEAGEYKVSFSCMVAKGGKTVGAGEKPDDFGAVQMTELVPPPYDDRTSADATPTRFTVKPGQNTFEFDIPAGKQ